MDILSFLTPKKLTYFIEENSSIRQALEKFSYHKYTAVPILNSEGEYVYTLSEGEILRFIKDNDFDKKISESTMISDIKRYRDYISLNINSSLDDIYKLIIQQNFIPVVDDRNVFIGIIKRKDVLNHILNNKK